jgi:hypothetical protein
MSTSGFVFPVLPGKEGIIREITRQLKERRGEYEESRARGGVSVERAYLQSTPDGKSLVVAYLETAGTFSDAMRALLASDSSLDRFFLDKNSEATGIDFRSAAFRDPELVGSWLAPNGGPRSRGFAFAAPLRLGKADEGRAFAREAYVARKAEMTESRLAQRLVREEVFLNETPAGDMIVVYVEGDDPVDANRRFAASSSAFDQWFKTRCRDIFPEFIDFNQPVPANEEIFSWVRSAVAAR